MNYFRVKIAYKGTHYFGWQAQSIDTLHEEKPTVEGTILNALKKITNYQPCTVSGASRTDGGVHARGQIAKITISQKISPEHLLLGLNSLLPTDIRILECVPSTKEYQASRGSVSKEYHYYFIASPVDNVATSDIALHLPIDSIGPDDLALLRSACRLFVGRHDFYNFSSRGSGTSFREIFYCDIHRANFSPLANDMFYLKIIGDGFLKYMIRYIMGALLELVRGRIVLDDISLYLQQHQEDKLSPRAKAKGLHLIRIEGPK
ncbi:tRNA pseudouridine(38-40) synthase TruA [Desulfotalea psychrophila]|uniref:tRNA pseudouridine synthase A 2 n=1 Tax=Desulfotalea psychrophila (strain LSv54 / DSM 12343) TaxID=177439 RepID=TRUA2_DESPS|nr:tRNA pseudouridine(38-40) synthase TruA [Desulfotalea psychrophila]Q6AKP0.1 RecName: Full=tRNA pseudouridine synthase A 2; AltName: Full=tRNA pseudouridine(38-40) synthase; AltName: Full=tRNA pseudouridylate synthase I 2; AltName: Full=tRNA-uridine isomerase I 2 [Desulfotalea psychrophila LSv54]CAG37085.1 related to tRNA pseudouridine synthase A [Desulfotalea psychrophila LSv54]